MENTRTELWLEEEGLRQQQSKLGHYKGVTVIFFFFKV